MSNFPVMPTSIVINEYVDYDGDGNLIDYAELFWEVARWLKNHPGKTSRDYFNEQRRNDIDPEEIPTE